MPLSRTMGKAANVEYNWLSVDLEDVYSAIRVVGMIQSTTTNTRFQFLDPWALQDLLEELAEEATVRLDALDAAYEEEDE